MRLTLLVVMILLLSQLTVNGQETTSINPPYDSSPTFTDREFNLELGGYSQNRGGEDYVYRNIIDQDVLVVDAWQTELGLITLELPTNWNGRSEFAQTRLFWTDKAHETLQSGITAMFLTAYIQQYETDAEGAMELLMSNAPFTLYWTNNSPALESSNISTPSTTVERTVIPNAGVSYIIVDSPMPRPGGATVPHMSIVTSFFTQGDQDNLVGAYQYGFEVSENGRLIIFAYRFGGNAVSYTSAMTGGSFDFLRVTQPRFQSRVPWHTNYYSVDNTAREVSISFGTGDLRVESYSDITDWDAWSLIGILDN